MNTGILFAVKGVVFRSPFTLNSRNGDFNELRLALILRVLYQSLTCKHKTSTTGASKYKLNDTVTYSVYNASLISHNILVKAKNFLVFQAMWKPSHLNHLANSPVS